MPAASSAVALVPDPVAITTPSRSGIDPPGAAAKNAVYTCTSNGTIPASAKLTDPYFTDNYWKHPSNPAANDYDPSVPFEP